MDYLKFIVPNQKEEPISTQGVKVQLTLGGWLWASASEAQASQA